MVLSRRSFTDRDVERIAETIAQLDYKNNINNRDSFNKVLAEYLGSNGEEILKDEVSVNRIFNKFVFDNPRKVTQPEDIKQKETFNIEERLKIKREYRYLGKSGQRIVYLRRSIETRNDQKVIVYRDRNGKSGIPKFKDEED